MAGVLTKVFLKTFCEWCSTKHSFLSEPLNLIGCHGNQMAKFPKNTKKKINSPETIWGIKLKLCRNVHSMSLYKFIGVYYLFISTLVAMATKFP